MPAATMSPRSSSPSPNGRAWFELLHGSVVRDLIRDSGAISVTAVVAARRDHSRQKRARPPPRPEACLARLSAQHPGGGRHRRRRPGCCNAISAQALGSLGMVFLVPVLVSAVFFGRRAAFVTALRSA